MADTTVDPALRQKWLDRQTDALKFIAHKKAVVFILYTDENGERVREKVDRNEVQYEWDQYTNSQKAFHPIRNEWDLCEELDPGAAYLRDLKEDEEERAFQRMDEDDVVEYRPRREDELDQVIEVVHLDLPSQDSTDQTMVQAVEDVVIDDPVPVVDDPVPMVVEQPMPALPNYEDDLDLDLYPDPQTFQPLSETLEATLHYRYGYIAPPDLAHFQHDIPDHEIPSDYVVLFILALKPPLSITRPMAIFIHTMATLSPRPPSQLWDLHATAFGDWHDTTLRVSSFLFDRVTRYVFTDRSDPSDYPWVIVIADPATVLECLRRSRGPHPSIASVRQLSRFLLTNGYPFTTRQALTTRPHLPLPLPPSFPGLGWRPKSYHHDRVDYAEYQVRLHDFMDLPRARAALLSGGIVWRLAWECVGDLTDTSVLDGPSDDALQCGDVLVNGSQYLVDDRLTLAELDLISGVYLQDTGKSPPLFHPLIRISFSRCVQSSFHGILVAQAGHLDVQRSRCRLLDFRL
jgi:hypothetical protein